IYLPTLLLTIPRNPVTAVGLPLAIGFARGLINRNGVKGDWFQNLCSSPGLYPYEAFRVVMPIFYISLGYASHLAVRVIDESASDDNTWNASAALAAYYVHLGLNLVWTPQFFKSKQSGLALANTALMTGSALFIAKMLDRPTQHEATFCLLPYCAWLAYMTYLNAGVWWLN
ncbi:hypothetical protein M378DRAFT_57765, partial [Amanita muscaria Koide BX008]